MSVLLVMAMVSCGKDEVKTPQIISTREVNNSGNIIVEATFDDASRMCFQIISATQAEVSSAKKFYLEDSVYWKYEGNVVVPEEFTHFGQTYSVVGIGNSAFYDCEALVSVDIPETVDYISGGAFADCAELETVKMPSRLEYIGQYAFAGCKELASIHIPEGIERIEMYTFTNCERLTSIRIPNSVEIVGYCSFYQCKNLASVEMPSVIGVLYGAFGVCENLKEIKMPAMQDISRYAFGGCTSLQSVELPSTLVIMDGYSFSNCTSLHSVICRATTPPTNYDNSTTSDELFYGCPLQEIKVPSASVDAYKTDDIWRNYADIIVGL